MDIFLRNLKTNLRKNYYLLEGKTTLIKIRIFRLLNYNTIGVNLIGFFESTFGIAEVGRFFSKRIIDSNISLHITNIPSQNHSTVNQEELIFYRNFYTPRSVYFKNIFFLNAPEIITYKKGNPNLFKGWYNAAVFFWEFDDYFYYPGVYKNLNEIIVFTDFIKKAIQKSAPENFKVSKLNFPFTQNWFISHSPLEVRNKLAIPEKDFVFFFNFDFFSVFERKNPLAILSAMELAFTTDDNIWLVLKTIHGESGKDYRQFEDVLSNMKLKNRVIIVNENASRNEMMSMINACDAYISLHRSEGLGLGMMEAMSMGKPVIATAFGGNMEFMNPENSLLVDYDLVELTHDMGPYKKGWMWADPNIETAANHMRKLYHDRNYAQKTGGYASKYISSRFTVKKFEIELKAWIKQN